MKPTKAKKTPEANEDAADDADDGGSAWKEESLETLLEMEPAAFERLAQRLLREAGFVSVEVTEKER